jgi:hypothetical protein
MIAPKVPDFEGDGRVHANKDSASAFSFATNEFNQNGNPYCPAGNMPS